MQPCFVALWTSLILVTKLLYTYYNKYWNDKMMIRTQCEIHLKTVLIDLSFFASTLASFSLNGHWPTFLPKTLCLKVFHTGMSACFVLATSMSVFIAEIDFIIWIGLTQIFINSTMALISLYHFYARTTLWKLWGQAG